MGLYIINCYHGLELGRACEECEKVTGMDTVRIVKAEKPWLGGP